MFPFDLPENTSKGGGVLRLTIGEIKREPCEEICLYQFFSNL